jgi:hypothetical protein
VQLLMDSSGFLTSSSRFNPGQMLGLVGIEDRAMALQAKLPALRLVVVGAPIAIPDVVAFDYVTVNKQLHLGFSAPDFSTPFYSCQMHVTEWISNKKKTLTGRATCGTGTDWLCSVECGWHLAGAACNRGHHTGNVHLVRTLLAL